MPNLTNPKAIWAKGLLFVLLGLLAAGTLLSRTPQLSSAILLGITVWAFCRAYYFAFYVIERYVDPSYRFTGLVDFVRYTILGTTTDRPDKR